ncbi:hypoxanthine phosphoribosyltransferase [Candidatus Roizmanbacteria bacterium]|nr:hypoxanthine phosphoribosyltransferase [Candidatus Roizmanbacteria bacterium]
MTDEILVSEEQIKKRMYELAKELKHDYGDKSFILLGILKGSFIVIADLIRALHKEGCFNSQLSFMTLKSYHSDESSQTDIKIVQDIDFNPKDKHILMVDDIFDTGKSFEFIYELMVKRGAASVEGFALLAKPDRHQVIYRPRYVGFTVPNVWVEGYGMDREEYGRGNPMVIVSKEK